MSMSLRDEDGRLVLRIDVPRLRATVIDGKVEQWEPQSRGVGDTVEKIAKRVGVKPCGGCRQRRDKLNQMFPYKGASQ